MTPALFIASLACLLAATVALARYLPAQNVAFIILFLGVVEAAVEFARQAGNLPDGALFWPGAVILLRTAGQGLLKRWRRTSNYGLILIAATSLTAAVLQLCFSSAQAAAGRLCLTALCLVVLAPWFVQKRVTASGESTNEISST